MPLSKIEKRKLKEKLQKDLKNQLRYQGLSDADRTELWNQCETADEAVDLLAAMPDTPPPSPPPNYKSRTDSSGSPRTPYQIQKQLFDKMSAFTREDIQDFINIAQATIAGNVVRYELLDKMNKMALKKHSPLQCMVYATKDVEADFYRDENAVRQWAGIIADFISNDIEQVRRVIHMLVNWKMWSKQIRLLMTAASELIVTEETKDHIALLDMVIRDNYSNSTDDALRFVVYQNMLTRPSRENYQCAFEILRRVNFLHGAYQRYIEELKEVGKAASSENLDLLHEVFVSYCVVGFGIQDEEKRKRIELALKRESDSHIQDFIEYINDPATSEADALKAVEDCLTTPQGGELIANVKAIKQHKAAIQDLLLRKLQKEQLTLNDRKKLCFSLIYMDSKKAVPKINQLLSQPRPDSEKLIYHFVLSRYDQKHIGKFVNEMLSYQKENIEEKPLLLIQRFPQNQDLVADAVLQRMQQIRRAYGVDSAEMLLAVRNYGAFMKSNSLDLYPKELDQLLFSYLGYEPETKTFNRGRCCSRNLDDVFHILDNVMNKENYSTRYMEFMQALFDHFKNVDKSPELRDTIKKKISKYSGIAPPGNDPRS
ncbi:MAG: hypothetical protein K5695_10700 [Oscillospiraceae bacterium]|nr:hypothetical protein [Oscillospiraceae bacterium]